METQRTGERALAQVLFVVPTDVLVAAGFDASAALLRLVSRAVRDALATRPHPLPVAFFPSALADIARQYPVTRLRPTREKTAAAYAATMANFAAALPFLGSLSILDLSALRLDEALAPGFPAFDARAFYADLQTHCPRLRFVLFGQLAMHVHGDADGGPDVADADVAHVAAWVASAVPRPAHAHHTRRPTMRPHVLEVLRFDYMRLKEEEAHVLLLASLATPTVHILSFAGNGMYRLRILMHDAAARATGLRKLDLSWNYFGGFYHSDLTDNAKGTAADLAALVTDMPSLCALSLKHNRLTDTDGAALAAALARHTHLTTLDLRENDGLSPETHLALRAAWAGPAEKLLL